MMSNGPPPARSDGTVDDARWFFPQERAHPPRDKGCKQNGFGDPAPQSNQPSSLSGASTLAKKVLMEPSWLTFAAANGFGVHRIRFGIVSGILHINRIPGVLGTVSQDPADGFCWILSHAGSTVQTNFVGNWSRTRLNRHPVPARHFPTRSNSSSPSSPCVG